MTRLGRISCVLAVGLWGAQATDALAQEARNMESLAAAGARHTPSASSVDVEKECIGAEGAQVCWLRFSDGTRCVVASNGDGGESSTALNCHFSTPMERLHRMPKD